MKYQTREQWLNAAMTIFRETFNSIGEPVPPKVRVSCGLPSKGAFGKKRAIGEAWASTASKDQHFEIFISPTIDDKRQVLGTLLHEMVHVTVGLKSGHKGRFCIVAAKLGLLPPWTATKEGEELQKELNNIAEKLGDYPHGTLNKMTNGTKKQSTRLIKANCPECGYTVRLTMKWILTATPQCPVYECEHHQKDMEIDLPQGDLDTIAKGLNAYRPPHAEQIEELRKDYWT